MSARTREEAEAASRSCPLPREGEKNGGRLWRSLPVCSGRAALLCLLAAVGLSALEAMYVQVTTTYKEPTWSVLGGSSFRLLACLDILVPLALALLSRRLFMVCLALQSLLSAVLLHYDAFFYNTLTLSTIYHSLQGAATLGVDIFGFARIGVIAALAGLGLLQLFLVQFSRVPASSMPGFQKARRPAAVVCLACICWIFMLIYGRTGLSVIWVDAEGHRPAVERRSEEGARESVRSIGYVATWVGEFLSGTYSDTDLIYQEARCEDPDGECGVAEDDGRIDGKADFWNGLPLPPATRHVALVQVESLDFAALDMRVNGHEVLPFLSELCADSLVLRLFAPHKVGSSNSDYELLNGRVAEQNVMYYTYIREYPDSVARLLSMQGKEPAVFHGLEGGLFNLRQAYAAQGFERFFFKEELADAGYPESRFIMNHVLDRDVFDRAARYLEQGEGEAVFVITMTTHIPFIDPLPEFSRGTGSFYRYVSSLRYFDDSFREFYERLPEDTLLILWGDHGSDVTYPSGFPKNSRHVPFLVHVKEKPVREEALPFADAVPAQAGRPAAPWFVDGRECPNMGAGARAVRPEVQSAGPPHLAVADPRVYTLCEISYYLRRMLEER